MNIMQCDSLARRVRRAAWYADLRTLAQHVRSARRDSGQLLVVGHPDDEPWHLTAHLDMLARFRHIPELRASLGDEESLDAASRHDTLLVVSERPVPVPLLERVHDARTKGSTVFGLSGADSELTDVADEALVLDVDRLGLGIPGITGDFEIASHLFGLAAASERTRLRLWGSAKK